MNIFEMNEEHILQVSKLEQDIFSSPYSEKSLREMFNDKNYQYFVYFDKKVLGYVGISSVLDESDITHIAVSLDSRRKNIGTLLLQKMVEYCKNKNIAKIHLEVRESNAKAIGLYEKNGFSRVGLRKNYYSNPKEHALLMTLEV
ncbi:MAG: ribosomal protein S18-alanine N-acetyltransferase [Clostridia bacterium]